MRGIYLVANRKSEVFCENLVYSIRRSRCTLPIRLIPFGGERVRAKSLLSEVEIVEVQDFPAEARHFIDELSVLLDDCPRGYLYRFLGWFGDWDEFIYSDNDIVALTSWESIFQHLDRNDVVHADEEYTTQGRFNYDEPQEVERVFGKDALLSAFTAGHFASCSRPEMVQDMRKAIEWFRQNPSVPKKHDQALLHIASLIGSWKMLNLCKPPHNWLSSWAGDYENSLALIQAMQSDETRRISHLHFSGGTPLGTEPISDLLNSNLDPSQRMAHLTKLGLSHLSGWNAVRQHSRRVKNGLRRRFADDLGRK